MRLVFFELSIKVVFVGWSYVGKALFVFVNCDIGLQLLTWMHVAVLFNCCHLVCISLVLIFSIVHLSERLLPSSCIAILVLWPFAKQSVLYSHCSQRWGLVRNWCWLWHSFQSRSRMRFKARKLILAVQCPVDYWLGPSLLDNNLLGILA